MESNYIYSITNTTNGKLYIGRTKNPDQRRRSHFNKLRQSKHENPKLQNAWNKYGEECFIFSIVDECKKEEVYDLETKWFDRYDRDEDLMYNCHFNSDGGKSLTKSGIQRNIDRMMPIIQDGYETGLGINKLAKKYCVSSEYIVNHIPIWETETGLVYQHPQTKEVIARLDKFAADFKEDEETTLANRDSYGISHKSFTKYLPEYGLTLEDVYKTKWREESIEKARLAYEYKIENRCTVMEAIRHTGANPTTLYKYIDEWRASDDRPFNSEEVSQCVILEMKDGMSMSKACKKWRISKDTVKKYCPEWVNYKNQRGA